MPQPLTWLVTLLPVAAAADQDHGAYDTLLRAHVSQGKVDYAGLASQGPALDAYLADIADASVAGMTRDQQLAFWINAYNALTLDVVSDSWPLASIRDLDGGKVWDSRTWTVAGRTVTLNDIEHTILRPMGDARIHAAINCASIGCPALAGRAYVAAGLGDQLDRAVGAWAKSNGLVVSAERVGVNTIFDWFGEDFTAWGPGHFDIPGVSGKHEAAINFLLPHLDAATQQQLKQGGYSVYWADYDWAVNKAP